MAEHLLKGNINYTVIWWIPVLKTCEKYKNYLNGNLWFLLLNWLVMITHIMMKELPLGKGLLSYQCSQFRPYYEDMIWLMDWSDIVFSNPCPELASLLPGKKTYELNPG
jgi:hypothetical protein